MRRLKYFLFKIWMFNLYLEGKMDIAKKQKFFAKKCLDIYKRETTAFELLPKAIDVTHLLFYQNIPELTVKSISGYLQSGISKKYEFLIYGTTKYSDDSVREITFKTLQITQLNKKNWFLFFSNIPLLNKLSIQNHSHSIIGNKCLTYFLKYFFMIFKVTKMLMKYQNGTLRKYSYVSIDDITNGLSRKIPDCYQNIPSNLKYDTFNLLCVKIFSENVISEHTIDREKMINQFNRLFDESKSKIFFGCYNYFLIYKNNSEIHEETDIHKLSYKTIINVYQIVFDDLQILEGGAKNLILLERSFCFKNFSYDFEFMYLFTSKNTKDSDYKFFILFSRDSRKFVFNYKWFMNRAYNDIIIESSFYLAVFAHFKLYLIEFIEEENPRYFKIHRVKCSDFRIKIFDEEKISYLGNLMSINSFIDMLIFYPNF
ncbi:hypothetical protein CWI38_0261p0020 [Hamiltosporidium tvaerminnensis]|uniref:Uncharacterized protein n=1 Tax=Hamiltosporidium tvaerminnensis TaxID=1176355 RepID=A0A4V2JY25_9MICR|nr:hypothetical protein CWI38_0261p0020 [Hamiltosporidium tvaerminnensis]